MTAITDKIKDFEAQGFQPQINGYIFGHSFGGQLASAIGRQFTGAQFKNIDSEFFLLASNLSVCPFSYRWLSLWWYASIR